MSRVRKSKSHGRDSESIEPMPVSHILERLKVEQGSDNPTPNTPENGGKTPAPLPRTYIERQRDHKDEVSLWSSQMTSYKGCADDLGDDFVRSFHPDLQNRETVAVAEDVHGRKIWVVLPGFEDTWVAEAEAGRRDIHVLPAMRHEVPEGSERKEPDALTSVTIDARKFLTESFLSIVRRTYPLCIGIRVLIAGYFVLLFRSEKDMESGWSQGFHTTIGRLRVAYAVADHVRSGMRAGSGNAAVAVRPESRAKGRLGLKVRFPGGLEAMTTSTHGFVKVKRSLKSVVHDRCSSAKRRLSSAKSDAEVPEQGGHQSPLDKSIYMAHGRRQVGQVTRTYDPGFGQCAPFPESFRHDLCLLTSDSLPPVEVPVDCPRISRWASYVEVLQGAPIFLCNPSGQNSTAAPGRRSRANNTRKAIIQGTEYIWGNNDECQNVSLLWRIAGGREDAERFPGAVLCCGSHLARTATAVVFENFEVRPKWRRGGPSVASPFRGGMLLPDEIRAAEIVMEDRKEEETGEDEKGGESQEGDKREEEETEKLEVEGGDDETEESD